MTARCLKLDKKSEHLSMVWSVLWIQRSGATGVKVHRGSAAVLRARAWDATDRLLMSPLSAAVLRLAPPGHRWMLCVPSQLNSIPQGLFTINTFA